MSKFLQDDTDDEKAIAIPQVFSEKLKMLVTNISPLPIMFQKHSQKPSPLGLINLKIVSFRVDKSQDCVVNS